MAKKTTGTTWKPGTEHPAIEQELMVYRDGRCPAVPAAAVKTRHGSVPCFEGHQIKEDGQGGHSVHDETGKEVIPGG